MCAPNFWERRERSRSLGEVGAVLPLELSTAFLVVVAYSSTFEEIFFCLFVVANESSRNETPDESYLKPRSLLKTITDDLEEDQTSDRPKSAVRLVDRPELINTDLPRDFMGSR